MSTTDTQDAANPADRSTLLSHAAAEGDAETLLHAAEARLRAAGDLPGAPVERQLDVLHALHGFELGRFLLRHRGLNADWTHRLVTYRPGTLPPNPASLEWLVFESVPAVLATRERFGIFQRETQALLRPGMALASVPCGWMGDLLLLDYSGCAGDFSLTGIDLDPQALEGARQLAGQRGLASHVSLRHEDAWAGSLHESVDVLTSNGLNIYEPDDARVVELYRAFFRALRPGGTLITSFLTPPPMLNPASSWRMAEVDPQMLALQHLLFTRIIDAKWSALRTHEQTRAQLEAAGFTDLRFVDDRLGMFPTVVARRP
ncbi:methyltransferase domain-containing protein [Dyella sp. BiH032]|uniref:SAM-dependent methyltransferase n=1 Tax=Dyella sp. BiH032 TaxID=3075430 RepID=UPI0028929C48|nr:methyltransferase domain-containing protein [Dyella sp. BiH032]WNL44412.1 methyltransferase domain-containing protein [Dyella sp. BiH032]